MIYIFRKEMKKWHTVLWVVFASFVLVGFSSAIIWHRQGPLKQSIAIVNGQPVYLKTFNHQLSLIEQRIEEIRGFARHYKFPVELFLSMYGLTDPNKKAFELSVQSTVLHSAQKNIGVVLCEEKINDAILKSLPQFLIKPDRSIDEQAYQRHLARMRMTVSEYEKLKEDELKIETLYSLISSASYISSKILREKIISRNNQKKFSVLKVCFAPFLAQAEKEKIQKEELESYYQSNKELYRIPEKRKAIYWFVHSKNYLPTLVIDDERVENFYKKNESTLFRVAPKVKVRRILLAKDSEKDSNIQLQHAQDLHAKLVADPENFETYAQDSSEVKQFKVIDFFEKGTYDKIFERAALRLTQTDEISPVIITDDGYEILQLIERIPATSKPLAAVQKEIIATLQAKEQQHAMRSDIAVAVRSIKTDAQAFDNFAQQHTLKKEHTEWLVSKDGAGSTLSAKIAKEIFAVKKTVGVHGMISHDDGYVLYQLTDTQKSTIPMLETLEKKMKTDLYKSKARTTLKQINKELRNSYFANKKTLEQSATELELIAHQTVWMKKTDSSDLIPPNVLERAFTLTDGQQLCKIKQGDDYYFIKLLDERSLEEKEQDEQALLTEEEKEEERIKSLYKSSFIAFLMRNATIETNEELLGINSRQAL